MRVCLKFIGNLAALLGSEVCVELSKCTTVGDVMWSLIRGRDAPITPDQLTYISASGGSLDLNDDICRYSEIYVVKALQGG